MAQRILTSIDLLLNVAPCIHAALKLSQEYTTNSIYNRAPI